jgi:integrase
MAKHNAANERIKRDYFEYLREAKRLSSPSIDAAAKAISRFEESTGWKDFRAFHIKQAVAFKARLAQQTSHATGTLLSKATLYSTLQALRSFFLWLADRPGFKSRVRYSDADYFNLSDKETRIAKASRDKAVPTLEQFHHVLEAMPTATDIERRDQALVAFAALSGARDGALASFRLKHVDLKRACVFHDARDVNTKFSKSFVTDFFPVGGKAEQIVADWIDHLRSQLLWCDEDPLFPATRVEAGPDRQFKVVGLDRRCWTTAGPIRKVFRNAFEGAGLPYFNPHSFRDMLAQLGERVCRSPEAMKAWSQNLGHEKVLTTLLSYGKVSASRQSEIMRSLGATTQSEPRATELEERMAALEARLKM